MNRPMLLALLITAACNNTSHPGETPCLLALDCPAAEACTTATCINDVCEYDTIPNCAMCDPGCDDGDPCTDDVCAPGNQCSNTPIDGCVGATGPVSGSIGVSVSPTGSPFFSAVFTLDPAADAAFAAEEVRLAGIAVGACAEETPTGSPFTATSVGDIVLSKGGTTLIDIPPDPSDEYYAYQFVAAVNDVIDAAFTGSSVVSPITLLALLHVPARPAFTGLAFDGNDKIGATFAYTAPGGTHFYLTFQYINGAGAHTLRCRLDPNGSSFTMSASDYANLGSTGTMRATSSNTKHVTVTATDGPRDLIATASASTNTVNYAKAP